MWTWMDSLTITTAECRGRDKDRRPSRELAEEHDLFPQVNPQPFADFGPTPVDERTNLSGGRTPIVHDEIAMRHRDARPAHGDALQSRSIDQRAGRPRSAVRDAV